MILAAACDPGTKYVWFGAACDTKLAFTSFSRVELSNLLMTKGSQMIICTIPPLLFTRQVYPRAIQRISVGITSATPTTQKGGLPDLRCHFSINETLGLQDQWNLFTT